MNPKHIITILLLLICSSTAAATDYYMKPTGNNGNTGLSIAQAWATPSYAVPHIYAGDTLWVLDGNYSDPNPIWLYSSNCGNVTHWTNIRRYNGTPVWYGGMNNIKGMNIGSPASGMWSDGFVLFEGITVKGYGEHALETTHCQNVTIRNCTFQDSMLSNGLVAVSTGSRDVIIDNCTFEDYCGYIALHIRGDRYYPTNLTHRVTIKDCLFWNITNHGCIQLSNYVGDSQIYNCTAYNCYSGFGTYSHQQYGTNNAYNISIYNCTTINTSYGLWGGYNNDSTYRDCSINARSTKPAMTCKGGANNMIFSNISITNAAECSDQEKSNQSNTDVTYKNITYDGWTTGYAWDISGGGSHTVQDDFHTPFTKIRASYAGGGTEITWRWTTNQLVTLPTTTYYGVGSGAYVVSPRWYPTISNLSLVSKPDNGVHCTLNIYNATLLPTSARLQNVSVSHRPAPLADWLTLSLNSSIASNPTWINATMFHASEPYNVTIDGGYIEQVNSGADSIVRYQRTITQTPQTIEFNHSSSWVVSNTAFYYDIADPITITTNKDGTNRFDPTPTEYDSVSYIKVVVS